MSTEIIKPDILKAGDKITLVNPVSVPPRQFRNYEPVIEMLQNRGYQVQLQVNHVDNPKYLARNFNLAVSDHPQAVMLVSGNRYGLDDGLLNRIDYEEIKNYPLIVTAFSAASALLISINDRTGLVCLYGPHISFFPDSNPNQENIFTRECYWNLVENTGPDSIPMTYVNHFSRNPSFNGDHVPFVGENIVQTTSDARGTIYPVYLQALIRTIEAGLQPNLKSKILIVESDNITFDEGFDQIRRLADLINISELSSLVIASLSCFKSGDSGEKLRAELHDPQRVKEFIDQVRRKLKHNVGVIYGFPMGHIANKYTIPMGVEGTINLESGDLTITENPFAS